MRMPARSWLDINKLDSEMIYVTSLPAGLGSNDVGLDRGLLDATRIVKFSKGWAQSIDDRSQL